MLIEAIIFFVLLAFLWKLQDDKKHRGFPPGPQRFPLVGNMPQLAMAKSSLPSLAMGELSEKYGDVMFLQMGCLPTVVFSSYATIVEIFNHETAGVTKALEVMPVLHDRSMRKNLGIIFSSGDSWQALRRFTIRTLRDFGFGKTLSMDFVVNEEFEKFIHHFNTQLEKSPDGVIQIENLFDITIINILWRLVTGINYDMDDSRISDLLRISNDWMQSLNIGKDLTVAFPYLHEYLGRQKQLEMMDRLHKFCQETINVRRKSAMYSSDPQCFVDVFLAKIEEEKDKDGSFFTDEQLLITILDLFQAGSETTSKSLSFGLLYMLLNPNVQEKVQAEIDSVVQNNVPITMSCKSQLPYCQATVLELLRCSSIVPVSAMRQPTEDFYCEGYLIKKGTGLMLNMEAVNKSKDIWGDPESFRPERFLTADGKFDAGFADQVFAFGGGRRKCLGVQLAECSLFLYFTSMMRHYQVVKVSGKPDPSTVPLLGLTYGPQPFEAKFVRRTC